MRRIAPTLSVLVVVIWMTSLSARPIQLATQSRSFTVSPGGSLQVNIRSGTIRVSTWERNEVLVDVVGLEAGDSPQLTMEQSGNAVRVSYQPRRARSDARFDIRVPTRYNLNLTTSHGDIRLEGSLDGEMVATTAGGDIRVGDVSARLQLTTSGGDISAGRVGGNAILKTSGGDVRVAGAEGEVSVKTAGGDIHVGDVGRSLEAETAGGDIHLGNVGGTASVSTAGGDIRVGSVSGSAQLQTAGGDIQLDGASGEVEAKTAGGDLSLRGISGSIQGETAGGDILASLNPAGGRESRLKSAGGDITLEIPSQAQATIQARIRFQGWRHSELEIQSDFPAAEQVRDPREIRATYQLNGGGQLITLETYDGDIRIRKRPLG